MSSHTTNHFDVIVVGLGAIGSAALYQLAKQGARVLGIDQYAPPHTLGSSHGKTRISRLLTGEGDVYAQLAQRTQAIWRDMAATTNRTIHQQTGGYFIAPQQQADKWHGDSGYLAQAQAVADRYQLAYEWLSAAQISSRLPLLNVTSHIHALYEPSGGVALPEAVIALQLQECGRLGAQVRLNEAVKYYKCDKKMLHVTSKAGSYTADRLILATGAWLTDLLPTRLHVYRQIMYWFETEEAGTFSADRFPWVIWLGETQRDFFTIFPTLGADSRTVKLMTEQYTTTTHPDTLTRTVAQHEIDYMIEQHIRPKMRGVTTCCVEAIACTYTMASDHHFIIDQHPDCEQITFAACCSGHGFKHTAAIGEALAQQALHGRSDIDLAPFSLARRHG